MTQLHAINEVFNCGGYDQVDWRGEEALRFNLVYGWNRSGKTTLARLLRLLEPGATPPKGFESSDVELATAVGRIRRGEADRLGASVRVFGKDFIRQHLGVDSSSAQAIVILGDESQELREEVATLSERETELIREREAAKTALKEAVSPERVLTDAARDVSTALGSLGLPDDSFNPRSYNRRSVRTLIEEQGWDSSSLESFLVPDESRLKALKEQLSAAKREITFPDLGISGLKALFDRANELVGRKVHVTALKRLDADQELREWVEEGHRLHSLSGDPTCLFCGAPVSLDLLERYGRYFTKELEQLERDLNASITDAQKAREQLKTKLPDSSAFFPDLASGYAEARGALEVHLSDLNRLVGRLLDRLIARRNEIRTSSSEKPPIELAEKTLAAADDAARAIDLLVRDQTARIQSGDSERAEVAQVVEAHLIAQRLVGEKYFDAVATREQLTAEMEGAEAALERLRVELNEKRTKLGTTGVALPLINEVIAHFIGEGEIELTEDPADEDGGAYLVLRRGERIPHLSESERSIVALSYFLVKLEEEGGSTAESIVVLDDPVDSQDGNHLFGTASLLRRRLDSAAQVIVLTHNYEFFNLIRDWFCSTQFHDQSRLYLLETTETDGRVVAEIKDLPVVLRDYKTEYQYLANRLLGFRDGTDGIDPALVPNVARKVLEYFAAFKWCCPTGEKFASIVTTRFIKDQNLRKQGIGDRVLKFVNEYSHGADFGRPITAAAMEARPICDAVLDFIYWADKDHYAALESAGR